MTNATTKKDVLACIKPYVTVSEKNKKIGKIGNFSLPPVKGCTKHCVHCMSYCYARPIYSRFPTARYAWDKNLATVKKSLPRFEESLGIFLSIYKGTFFRIHVSGDFFSQDYLEAWFRIIKTSKVKFFAFTRAYDLDWTNKPSNLKRIWSVDDKNIDAVPNDGTSRAYVTEVGDIRKPTRKGEKVFECLCNSGKYDADECTHCGYRCAKMSNRWSVNFTKHN